MVTVAVAAAAVGRAAVQRRRLMVVIVGPAVVPATCRSRSPRPLRRRADLSALFCTDIGMSRVRALVKTLMGQDVSTALLISCLCHTLLNVPCSGSLLVWLLLLLFAAVRTQGWRSLFKGLDSKLLQTVLTAAFHLVA